MLPIPLSTTALGTPTLQRFVVGATAEYTPLAVPQVPLTGKGHATTDMLAALGMLLTKAMASLPVAARKEATRELILFWERIVPE